MEFLFHFVCSSTCHTRLDTKSCHQPETMRKLRLLLLPLGLLQGLLSQTIHVSQIPVISVVKSSSVTLPCDYTINSAQEGTIGSYKWYKHSVKPAMEISNSKNEFIGRISRANTDRFIKEQSAAITLHRVGFSDSGMYYCEVSFQIGRDINVCGDGTFLNVTGSGDDPCPVNDSNCSCYGEAMSMKCLEADCAHGSPGLSRLQGSGQF
ncbi:natural cytotoxicity triggering receptor 3-like [Mantella aurantiaca]